MGVIRRKIWRDLLGSKFRTLLVVLSTAVGVFALGLVFGLSGTVRTRMTEAYQSSVPAHITFWWVSRFDADVVETVQRMPGVADAEAGAVELIRWKLKGETEWREQMAVVRTRPDYASQHIDTMGLELGEWPQSAGLRRTLAVAGQTARAFAAPLGATVLFEAGGRELPLPVTGVLRDAGGFPPSMGGDPQFFVAPATFAWLTGLEEGFYRLSVRVNAYSADGATEAAEQIKDRLQDMGLSVGGYGISDPNRHPAQQQLDAVMMILVVMGVLALALSGFLVINMMNALVAQQVRQIGMMKAVGATRGHVTRIYLSMALCYGLLSLALAVPLGAVAAHLASRWLLDMFYVPVGPFRLEPVALLVQVVVGLLVPLMTALVPVVGAARTTVRKAISDYGLSNGFGRSWLDRLIGRLRGLPRPLTLSLRNTFRRKARILLTLAALTLGGVMFIAVLSASASMTSTIDVALGEYGFDIGIYLQDLYRTPRLIEVTESVSGVVRAEVWEPWDARLQLPSGAQRTMLIWGIPSDTQMFAPQIVDGRNLLPEDGAAIVLSKLVAEEEGIRIGDVITLTVNERESRWTVVGLVVSVDNFSVVHYDELGWATGTPNMGSTVNVLCARHDAETLAAVERDLRELFAAQNIQAGRYETTDDIERRVQNQFDIVTTLLMVMAILAAVVGSIGLMTTMSINVVERAREIGVMRAIGAGSGAVLGIFVVEGVFVGVLSWLLAVPISYPVAALFSSLLGNSLLKVPLDFQYPLNGTVMWLAIAVVLAGVASVFPAWRATRVSVREALAYE